MKDKVLISVIVTAYNIKDYLPRCLDSLLRQTYENLEVIVVDDGSIDGTAAICDDYAAKNARIRVIHKENGGPSSARNAGVAIAHGEYLGVQSIVFVPLSILTSICIILGKNFFYFKSEKLENFQNFTFKTLKNAHILYERSRYFFV